MDIDLFQRRFENHDESLFEYLSKLARVNPALAESLAWTTLSRADGRGDMGLCADLYKSLKEIIGEKEVEQRVLNAWKDLSELGRINMCYAARKTDAMSTRLIFTLLDRASETSVHERHLLVAALAIAAKDRGIAPDWNALEYKVGIYEDPKRQQALMAFFQRLRREVLGSHWDPNSPTE